MCSKGFFSDSLLQSLYSTQEQVILSTQGCEIPAPAEGREGGTM